MPPPPQADEKIAVVIANTINRPAEFVREMKFEIRDITNDLQDMSFVIANAPLLACLSAGCMLA